MRCFLALAANIAIGVMAGFGVADAVVATGWTPMLYECAGLVGGGLAGAAACL
jgi:hypothetical protein